MIDTLREKREGNSKLVKLQILRNEPIDIL
jgi:hypothetical protein